MTRTPFGLTTLMESLKHSEEQKQEAELMLESIIGESAVSDVVKSQLIGDSVEGDIDADDVDENDPELNKLLDLIPEDDETENLISDMDEILESAIIADMNGNEEY